MTLEQELRNQVKDEIGDDENIKFPEKNILLQKYGVIPPVLLDGEVEYWTERDARVPWIEKEGVCVQA